MNTNKPYEFVFMMNTTESNISAIESKPYEFTLQLDNIKQIDEPETNTSYVFNLDFGDINTVSITNTDLEIETTDEGYMDMEDLPHNCIFNKVITGCGATTIALTNKENYIIAVPTTELIVNKTGRTSPGVGKDNVFGLFGTFSYGLKKEVREYLKGTGAKKIICTYDKIKALTELLIPSEFRLLIDEYQQLLKAYGYRDKSINGVLNMFKEYKSYCFMSATPLKMDFTPNCMSEIPVITAKWDEKYLMRLNVVLRKTNKPYNMVLDYISAYKEYGYLEVNGIKSYEAYFFVNSVKDIKKILDKADLSNDDVRIICANTEKNRSSLNGYDISTSLDNNKMFNFITSKAFEGCDYYSETGFVFVVSNASNTNTLLDIDTDIPQIAGRIRTASNPFRNMLVHIFSNQLDDIDIDYEVIKERTDKNIETAYKTIELFNGSDKDVKDNLREKLKDMLNTLYISHNDDSDTFEFNDIMPKLELYNARIRKHIYKAGLTVKNTYKEAGHNTSAILWTEYKREDTITEKKDDTNKKHTFKSAAKLYCDKDTTLITKGFLQLQFPELRYYEDMIGIKGIIRCQYVKKQIKEMILQLDESKGKRYKAMVYIKDRIPNKMIIKSKVKALVKEANEYAGLLDKKVTVSIDDLFELVSSTTYIDGKRVNVYIIIRDKIVFKN